MRYIEHKYIFMMEKDLTTFKEFRKLGMDENVKELGELDDAPIGTPEEEQQRNQLVNILWRENLCNIFLRQK